MSASAGLRNGAPADLIPETYPSEHRPEILACRRLRQAASLHPQPVPWTPRTLLTRNVADIFKDKRLEWPERGRVQQLAGSALSIILLSYWTFVLRQILSSSFV